MISVCVLDSPITEGTGNGFCLCLKGWKILNELNDELNHLTGKYNKEYHLHVASKFCVACKTPSLSWCVWEKHRVLPPKPRWVRCYALECVKYAAHPLILMRAVDDWQAMQCHVHYRRWIAFDNERDIVKLVHKKKNSLHKQEINKKKTLNQHVKKRKVIQGPERAALCRVDVYLIWCVLGVWLSLNCTTGESSGSDVTQVDLSFWRGSSSRLTPNDDSTTRQDLQGKTNQCECLYNVS